MLVVMGAAGVGAAELTGRELIEQAQTRNGLSTWRDRKSVVTFETLGGVTRTFEAEVFEQSNPCGEHRTFIEFLAPHDHQGTRFLHVSPRRTRDQWWTWSPATRRVRKLGGTAGGLQRDEVFVGRAMSYEDLELLVRIQQWTEAEGTATREGEDPCAGTVCDRVAVVPVPGNDEFPCARYRLWFSRDDLLLRRAELYDPENRLMKTVACEGYFASGRFQAARKCVVEHVNGTRSTITVKEVLYDTGLSDDLFTLAHLSEGR